MPSNDRVIRASEIGEYLLCRRAWWLHRVQGIESANRAQMQTGTARHAQHGRMVQRADAFRRVAIVLFALAVFFACAFTLFLLSPPPG